MLKFLKTLLDPRPQLFFFALLAITLQLFVWIFSPAQGPVVLYKLGLPVLAAIAGLFFDFAAFPYARPDSYLDDYWKKDPDADNPGNADYPLLKVTLRLLTLPACAAQSLSARLFWLYRWGCSRGCASFNARFPLAVRVQAAPSPRL